MAELSKKALMVLERSFSYEENVLRYQPESRGAGIRSTQLQDCVGLTEYKGIGLAPSVPCMFSLWVWMRKLADFENPYDEKEWELSVLHWLHLREGAESVQWVSPDSGGDDFGIDILIRSRGAAYQCYAPQTVRSAKELYEKQRTKITDDIRKLIKFKDGVESLLGTVKLSRWILAVPRQAGKEIVQHAVRKAEEIKKVGLPFLTDDFEILIHSESSFNAEKQKSISRAMSSVELDADPVPPAQSSSWIDENDELFENLISKLKKVHPHLSNDEIQKLARQFLDFFLIKQQFLETIANEIPEVRKPILSVLDAREGRLVFLGAVNEQPPNEVFRIEYDALVTALNDANTILGQGTAQKIASGTVSDWLLRCPLDFPGRVSNDS